MIIILGGIQRKHILWWAHCVTAGDTFIMRGTSTAFTVVVGGGVQGSIEGSSRRGGGALGGSTRRGGAAGEGGH